MRESLFTLTSNARAEYIQCSRKEDKVPGWRVGKHSFIPYDNVALSLAGSGSRGGSDDGGRPVIMTPLLQEVIKLLQLSRVELEEFISQELQENPALEEGSAEEADASFNLSSLESQLNSADDFAEMIERAEREQIMRALKILERSSEHLPVDGLGTIDCREYLATYFNSIHGSLTAEAVSEDAVCAAPEGEFSSQKTALEDHLVWQLRMSKFSAEETAIAMLIVQNLDRNGYLAATLEDICLATGGTGEKAAAVLKRVQSLDPVGVAARNLRECLLKQLETLQLQDPLAIRIVESYLSNLESSSYDVLAKELGVEIAAIADAAHLIASLEPKPSRGFEQDEVWTVLPDVFVEKLGDQYKIYLNEDGLPRLRVNSRYRRMAGQESAAEEQSRKYLQEKVRAATCLIKSIKQRQQTLFRVTQSIFKFQQDFLEHGVSALRPMVLRDVAEDIHMHESTVSRAVANKYVHTPYGLFELKFFFSTPTEGPDPLDPSEHIVSRLSADSLKIARRTAAKYCGETPLPTRPK